MGSDDITTEYKIFHLFKDKWDKGVSEMVPLSKEICNEKSKLPLSEPNKRKEKKINKTIEKLEEQFKSLQEENIIKFKVESNFTKDENVTKNVEYVFKFSEIICGVDPRTSWTLQLQK